MHGRDVLERLAEHVAVDGGGERHPGDGALRGLVKAEDVLLLLGEAEAFPRRGVRCSLLIHS